MRYTIRVWDTTTLTSQLSFKIAKYREVTHDTKSIAYSLCDSQCTVVQVNPHFIVASNPLQQIHNAYANT